MKFLVVADEHGERPPAGLVTVLFVITAALSPTGGLGAGERGRALRGRARGGWRAGRALAGLGLACLAWAWPARAAEPYPPLPPTLSTSVTPNVVLHVDNSGSMRERVQGSRATRMEVARDVAKELIRDNPQLRWGLFTFDPNPNCAVRGGWWGCLRYPNEIAGILQAPVGSSANTLNAAIDRLYPATWTPLGEALFEITRYYEGKPSYYGKIGGNYTSPIQYRCQKNFAIVVTDGEPTMDDELPGSGRSAVGYVSRDDTGKAVPKTFSTAGGNWALRNVAGYAYDMDMRVGGVDLDGKSFDDPKFARQNMVTYTVGFTINNDILAQTATYGHGSYYTANDKAQLLEALKNAVGEISATASNAGGVAVLSDAMSAGNKVFQPIFNPGGWYGELRCFDLDAKGDIIDAGCSPNKVASIPTPAQRRLHSAKVAAGVTTPFSFDDGSGFATMTAAQKTALGVDTAQQRNMINYLRGVKFPGMRPRDKGLLGDIVNGRPVVVGSPSGSTPDADWAAFKTAHAARGMVFVGANDGMLHAFDIKSMSEKMGYIPSPVYPRLKALAATNYGLSGGTPHVFHVNGSLRQQDIKTGGGWETLLVGGLAQGGKGWFALDATQAANFNKAEKTVKWEWTSDNDSDVGYSFGAPLIYNVRTSADTVVAAVILSNGYQNNFDGTKPPGKQAANTSALYVVAADSGKLLAKISVPGSGNTSTGLSAPAGVDFGQDGVLDYVYAGDIDGKLWRFDLTADDPSRFKAVGPIFDAGARQPIILRPAVVPVNKSNGDPVGNMVLFGTGKLFAEADRNNADTQTFYGVLDTMERSPATVARDRLLEQKIVDTHSDNGGGGVRRAGNYRKVSTHKLDLRSDRETRRGWYVDLPVRTERLVAAPLAYGNVLLFGTGIPESLQKCLPGGTGWIMGLDPLTGSVATGSRGQDISFLDIELDTKTTEADKINFPGGAAFASGFEVPAIPNELSYVADHGKPVEPDLPDTGKDAIGAGIALREANLMAVYTANGANTGGGASGTTRWRAIERSGSRWNRGKIIYDGGTGCRGGRDADGKPCTADGTAETAGIVIETSTWREIK